MTVTSLNAADFGLTSGGGVDQTSNLQAAINAAQTQKLPLFIPEGYFPITSVYITDSIEIYGMARTAQIVGFGQSPSFIVGSGVSGTRIGPVIIRDLNIWAASVAFPSGTDPAIIQATDVDDLKVRDCSIRDSGYHGIRMTNSSGRIQNNEIPGAAQMGIYVMDSSAAVFIDQNKISYSGNNGVYIWRSSAGSDQSVVSNNQIGFTSANDGGTGWNGNAVFVDSAHYVKVIDNMIYITAFSAIRFSNSNNAVISGNQCYDSQENAIYIEAPGEEVTWYGGIIADNRVDQCGGGIITGNSNFGAHWVSVTGNQVSNCVQNTIEGYGTTWGNAISVEADSLVANNQIDGGAGWGVAIYPTNNGTIGTQKVLGQVQNNMIKNCAGGIAFYKDDTTYGRLFIGGNMIYNYTTTTKFAAVVPMSYNGATGEISKIAGATDLGNATSSGFANVKLLLNYSFT